MNDDIKSPQGRTVRQINFADDDSMLVTPVRPPPTPSNIHRRFDGVANFGIRKNTQLSTVPEEIEFDVSQSKRVRYDADHLLQAPVPVLASVNQRLGDSLPMIPLSQQHQQRTCRHDSFMPTTNAVPQQADSPKPGPASRKHFIFKTPNPRSRTTEHLPKSNPASVIAQFGAFAGQPYSKLKPSEDGIKPISTASDDDSSATDITILNNLTRPPIVPCCDQSYLLALTEGRCKASREIGIAILQLSSNYVYISQFSDDLLYSRLYNRLVLQFPSCVVLPITLKKNAVIIEFFHRCGLKSKRRSVDIQNVLILLSNLKYDFFDLTEIVFCERSYFNESKGIEALCYYSCYDPVVVQQYTKQKYYCLAAMAGLFHHCCKDLSLQLNRASCAFEYVSVDSNMLIDPITLDSLQIVPYSSSHNQSLYTLLDQTKTVDGRKLLRQNLIEPPCDHATIVGRQDCIQEMVSNPQLFMDLNECFSRLIVKNVNDLIVNLIQKSPAKQSPTTLLNHFISLKMIFQEIPLLQRCLLNSENIMFKSFAAHLCDNNFDRINTILNQVLVDQIVHETNRTNYNKCKLIKTGCSASLDMFMKFYEEIGMELGQFQSKVEKEHQLRLARLGVGYCFVSTEKKEINGMIRRSMMNGNKYIYISQQLELLRVRLDQNLKECLEEVKILLLEKVQLLRSHLQYLFQLMNIIPMLDFLLSVSIITIKNGWVRPHFGDSTTITKGRHPLVEQHRKCRPNSVHLEKFANAMIVTGPNNSGKSVLLRQLAALQILAQIGSYVPAEKATFVIRDRIFARIGLSDDLGSNCSSFLKEVRQMTFIRTNATRNSLVLIDELGRGTATEIGAAFCFVLTEQLILQGSFVALATHFDEPLYLRKLYITTNMYCAFFAFF